MKSSLCLNDNQRENLSVINRSGEHLLMLINDIFEMPREDGQGASNNARAGTQSAVPLTPEALAMLPSDILKTLEQAAAQVNVKQVNAAIASVRQHNASAAAALAFLAKDFKYQDIWNMIQQVTP